MPMTMCSLRILLVVGGLWLLACAGCATVDQKIGLAYSPVDRSFGRHSGQLAVQRAEPERPAPRNGRGEWIIGPLTNVHGVRQADLLADRSLGEWVTEALMLELKQAGFSVSQVSPASPGVAGGMVISDINASVSISKGLISDEARQEIRFTIDLYRDGVKLKSFGVASRDNRVYPFAASRTDQEKALVQSLQDAMKQVMPEIVTLFGSR